MDLWIRSQDKAILSSISFVNYSTKILDRKEGEFYHREGHYIESGGMLLGEYKTKERALEVLGEIQKLLLGDLVLKNTDFEEGIAEYIKPYKCFAINDTYNPSSSIEFLHRDCVVFEMPQE